MEDYKKKYEDALERARIWKEKSGMPIDKQGILDNIFPELKKSEGEESKKWILEYLHDGLRKSDEQFKDQFKAAIAWLEKQGEQSNNEDVEKEKNDYVSGQFLYCKGSFNEFKEGESYWLEYVGNDNYIGRSDNILNQKFHITPRQLYTWLDPRHAYNCNETNAPTEQGEKDSSVKPPTFTFDDVLALQCCMETVKKVQEDKDLYEKLKDIHGRVYDAYQLEKQGEQKPFDYENANIQQKDFAPKVEPKYKAGDWIVSKYGDLFQIKEVIAGSYKLLCPSGNEEINSVRIVDNNSHLWSIKDAKDGDVLVNGSNIFIFHFINGTRLMGYCHVNIDDGRFYDDLGKNECFCLIDAIVTPVTKEQRELLFRKMKEEGFEWDATTKELSHKEVTKKSDKVEWNDEDQDFFGLLEGYLEFDYSLSMNDKANTLDWLKSIKERLQ